MDPRVRKHAEILTHYSVRVKEGDTVLISGNVETVPLLREVYRSVIQLGGLPKANLIDEDLEEILLKTGSERQLEYVPASVKHDIENMDCIISVWGGRNTRRLSGTDPKMQKTRARGRREIMDILMERSATGALRWCGTLFPTDSGAQEASMSLTDFEDFVYRACHVDKEDPVAMWKGVDEEQTRICEILDTKKELTIVSEGTDISMSIEGRKWISCSGKENLPDGEVFTGPVEDTVNGKIRFTYPAIFAGREIEGVDLSFKDGKVTGASAVKGEDFLKEILDTDEGARFAGEIAVGTNHNIQRFTRNLLFDEKIGGTVHLALGSSIRESGGKNKSAIHWDMICDMKKQGQIHADGQLIYKDGKFLI
jgi:aminopeptidase